LVPQIPEALANRLLAIGDPSAIARGERTAAADGTSTIEGLPADLRQEVENQPNFSYDLRDRLHVFLDEKIAEADSERKVELRQLQTAVDQLDLPQLSLPWQMVFYLSAGFVAIITVSLLTPRTSQAKLERFYTCFRTPIGQNEPETEPFTLPPGVKPGPRKVWFDAFDLELQKISLTGFIGFVVATVAVCALVAVVYWLFSIGA
jgi:hypothetical protein